MCIIIISEKITVLIIDESVAKESNGKQASELKPFSIVNNSFKKIVITRNELMPWYDENGIYHIGLIDFLLRDEAI